VLDIVVSIIFIAIVLFFSSFLWVALFSISMYSDSHIF